MESPNESLRDDWQARLINLLDDSLANQETEIGSLLKTHQDALVEPNEWLPDEDAVRRSARFLVRRDVSWVEFLKSTVDSFGSLAHSGVSLDTDGKGRRILTACDRQIKMMSDLIEIGRPGATAAGIWGILTGVNSTFAVPALPGFSTRPSASSEMIDVEEGRSAVCPNETPIPTPEDLSKRFRKLYDLIKE